MRAEKTERREERFDDIFFVLKFDERSDSHSELWKAKPKQGAISQRSLCDAGDEMRKTSGVERRNCEIEIRQSLPLSFVSPFFAFVWPQLGGGVLCWGITVWL
jgi:hypothetical protein